MLKIVGHNSYIVMKDSNQVEYKSKDKYPIPKIHNDYKLSFDKWNEKYNHEIDNIWECFITNLKSMSISEQYYISHYNMTQLKTDFLKLLYKTSDNAYKNYA